MQERGMHINEQELLVVPKGLRVIYSSQSNTTLLIKSDNMTTVSYIIKKGGCKSSVLKGIAGSIWLWAMNRCIFLVSCHIPGKENIHGDSLSRNFARKTEWMLDRAVYKMLTKNFIFHKVD